MCLIVGQVRQRSMDTANRRGGQEACFRLQACSFDPPLEQLLHRAFEPAPTTSCPERHVAPPDPKSPLRLSQFRLHQLSRQDGCGLCRIGQAPGSPWGSDLLRGLERSTQELVTTLASSPPPQPLLTRRPLDVPPPLSDTYGARFRSASPQKQGRRRSGGRAASRPIPALARGSGRLRRQVATDRCSLAVRRMRCGKGGSTVSRSHVEAAKWS